MTAFLTWYLLVTLLGWLTFPLAFALFPALADRGYTLSRAAGMLIWGYVFWLFASLGIAQNDSGGIILALIVIAALSGWSLVNRKSEIVNFLKSNLPLLLTTEILFLAAFAFLAFVRAANPELNGTERPMELAFINAILRSPTFPPQDPWLSGYAISYYYFGYVMTAMLARLSGIPGTAAHNLMTALIFALGAIGAYGILYNLLSQSPITNHQLPISNRKSPIFNSLLAPLFLLLVSNFEALLEVFHRLGWFWTKNASGQYVSAFWTWLDMKELSMPPLEPFQFAPDRYLWWWRASRVIQDYDMQGNHLEVIDEFPFFSFLLGDLHPHVLATRDFYSPPFSSAGLPSSTPGTFSSPPRCSSAPTFSGAPAKTAGIGSVSKTSFCSVSRWAFLPSCSTSPSILDFPRRRAGFYQTSSTSPAALIFG